MGVTRRLPCWAVGTAVIVAVGALSTGTALGFYATSNGGWISSPTYGQEFTVGDPLTVTSHHQISVGYGGGDNVASCWQQRNSAIGAGVPMKTQRDPLDPSLWYTSPGQVTDLLLDNPGTAKNAGENWTANGGNWFQNYGDTMQGIGSLTAVPFKVKPKGGGSPLGDDSQAADGVPASVLGF